MTTKLSLAYLCIFVIFFYLKSAPATSGRAEDVALLPHALNVPYIRHIGKVQNGGARGSGLLVLSLRR